MVGVGFESRSPLSERLSQVRVLTVFIQEEANLFRHGRRSHFCLRKRLRKTPGVQDFNLPMSPLRYSPIPPLRVPHLSSSALNFTKET